MQLRQGRYDIQAGIMSGCAGAGHGAKVGDVSDMDVGDMRSRFNQFLIFGSNAFNKAIYFIDKLLYFRRVWQFFYLSGCGIYEIAARCKVQYIAQFPYKGIDFSQIITMKSLPFLITYYCVHTPKIQKPQPFTARVSKKTPSSYSRGRPSALHCAIYAVSLSIASWVNLSASASIALALSRLPMDNS